MASDAEAIMILPSSDTSTLENRGLLMGWRLYNAGSAGWVGWAMAYPIKGKLLLLIRYCACA